MKNVYNWPGFLTKSDVAACIVVNFLQIGYELIARLFYYDFQEIIKKKKLFLRMR